LIGLDAVIRDQGFGGPHRKGGAIDERHRMPMPQRDHLLNLLGRRGHRLFGHVERKALAALAISGGAFGV